LQTDTS